MRNFLKRKKKTEWSNKPEVKSEAIQPIEFKTPKPHKPRKLHVPGLRTAKRVLASFLLIANLLVGISGLIFPGGYVLAIFFFLNIFIFLDYLHKTKKVKIDWNKEKNERT